MSIHIIEISEVTVELVGDQSTITITLPQDYRSRCIDNPKERRNLENLHLSDRDWIRKQINTILHSNTGKGILADYEHPMRSPGAGVLPCIMLDPSSKDKDIILHIRGSNRGDVWPLGIDLPHLFCWKEFAGVTGSAGELEDLRKTAIMELYEELSLISIDRVLLPSDIHNYPDTHRQLKIALERINRHYQFNLSLSYEAYERVGFGELEGDNNTTVRIITPYGKKIEFNAIVNYDPFTNALEISFLTTLRIREPLTGIVSLSGPEDYNVDLKPYMEDIIVVKRDNLVQAERGKAVNAIHLLSVHGPTNFSKSKQGYVFYTPSPTLEPIISYMRGEYSFRSVLQSVAEKF